MLQWELDDMFEVVEGELRRRSCNDFMDLLADSFFEGAKEFVEFEELFVHVERLVLELLDCLGAVGEDEGEGWVGRR